MGQHTTSPRTVEARIRQGKAVQLRIAGLRYEDIAKQLGYAHPSGAQKAVKAALRRSVEQPAEELRQIEIERIEDLHRALWVRALSGHLGYVDRILKIMERRARLLGLDPEKGTSFMVHAEGDVTALGLDVKVPDDPAEQERLAAAIREVQSCLGRSQP